MNQRQFKNFFGIKSFYDNIQNESVFTDIECLMLSMLFKPVG